jgi:hypothetical protein
MTFVYPPPVDWLQTVSGVRDVQMSGSTMHLVVEGSLASLMAAVAPYWIDRVVTHEPDLEEIFLAYYNGQQHYEGQQQHNEQQQQQQYDGQQQPYEQQQQQYDGQQQQYEGQQPYEQQQPYEGQQHYEGRQE